MRDLYQNESDTSADDDEVFNDPEDVWEKETSVSSPACTQNGLHNLPKAFGLSKTTPVMSMWRGPVSTSSPRCSQDVEMSMVRACKSLLSAVGDSLTALSFEESVVDKVLSTCQRIKENTAAVLDCDTRKSSNGAMDTSWARPVLQLVADVHLLASHTTLWSSFYDGLQSSLLRDLLARSTDQVKVIGHQASSLLQGCEGKLTSLMSESGHKLTSALLALCETCGEMALATDSQVLRLDQSSRNYSHCQLSPEVSKSFLRGCSMFVNRTLEGGMASLDDCEQKCTGWKDMEEGGAAGDEMSQRLSHVLSCIQALLRRTLQVQTELDKEMDDGSDPRPPQYYSTTYKRLQGIVSNVSSVVDSSTLLVESAETIVQGTGQDGKRLERCAELIQKSSQRLLSVSSYTYTPSSSYLITSSSWSTLSSQKQQQDSTISSSSSSVSKAPSSSSSISSVPSQSDISTSTATVSVSSNSTISASTDDNSNNATNETDLTDVTLLSESQLGQLDSATHEVSMAMALFTEYARKTWGKSPERGAVTPRGRRLLPQSPEKSVVTPAMNAAHMRRWNIKRTIALASRDGKDT